MNARELARFVPDCARLFGRLVRDPRVPVRWKLLLLLTGAYLAFPLDLVPDFLPVVGQLDDALVVALALRGVVAGAGAAVVEDRWPGPPASLRVVLGLAGVPAGDGAADRTVSS